MGSFEDPTRTAALEREKPWVELDAPQGWRAEITHRGWGYEARFDCGLMEKTVRPWRPTRRWIERVARRHLKRYRRSPRETYWLDEKPEPWRHTGGYPSGHRRVTELPKVPGGPAPGARATD